MDTMMEKKVRKEKGGKTKIVRKRVESDRVED